MDQIKIGKFISENRKKQGMTQEQLAERLNISKNAVSKWERGLNLPDVSIMPEVCRLLDITLNELFAGERIEDGEYKKIADDNLLKALENSSFTLKEKIAFYKKKWRREHVFKFVWCLIILLALALAMKWQNVPSYLAGAITGLIGVSFYGILNNQMMIYVESHVYEKIEKTKILEKDEKNSR